MNLLKILYPDRCPLCDTALPINGENGFCALCKKKIEESKGPFYIKGSSDIQYIDSGLCALPYSLAGAGIYKFKYMNRAAYGEVFGDIMAQRGREYLEGIQPDLIIPVPLHKKRLIKRGYNQANELAIGVSRRTGIPVSENAVMRVRNTAPQKLMSKNKRGINVKKAFIVIENVVNFRRVVVIDDIFTTGSTINAIAGELKAAGVEKVFFLTLARAGI